ncbi:MAG: hypothetical protein WBG54_24080 [Acidobacteriaceae bacterium]
MARLCRSAQNGRGTAAPACGAPGDNRAAPLLIEAFWEARSTGLVIQQTTSSFAEKY